MRINVYGGPGTGKSTLAAWIFQALKERHYCVELITEYIKSWAWQQIPAKSWDQLYIFAKQLRAEDLILRHGYTNLVTDSPLLMQLVYQKINRSPHFDECMSICHKFEEQFPSMNIYLTRSTPYRQEGRYQTEEEAAKIDELIEYMLDVSGGGYEEFDPVNGDYAKLLETLIRDMDYLNGQKAKR